MLFRSKKKSTRNDIAMAYRINSLGYGRKRVSKEIFLQSLLAFLDGEGDIPRGWHISWLWRNSRKSKFGSDSLTNVVANSRDSFMTVMRRRIKRDLDALKPTSSDEHKRRSAAAKKGWKTRRRNMPKMRRRKVGRKKNRKRR